VSPAKPTTLAPKEAIELIELELTDRESVEAAVRSTRPNRIFHLAAQSHVPSSWEQPAETTDVNVLGTLRLIEAMRRWAPDGAFVLAGSSDCYDHAAAPGTGLTPRTPMRAATPYALSKLAAWNWPADCGNRAACASRSRF
jgi:GDP-4-dehydro-6-deoxy-D-mannose reductase